MKKLSTKVTYSLDPATVLEIRQLATAWKVAKSEVVRRGTWKAPQKDFSERIEEAGRERKASSRR